MVFNKTFYFNGCQALNCSIECVMVNDEPWLKGKSVATVLETADKDQALRLIVDDEGKLKYSTFVSLHPSRNIHRMDAGVGKCFFNE